ncbi:MAG TPA: 50S ribosomal protein L17 [Tangfeifania sp.]|nr:50S ribosomal protein L17 [Tangfeifania sp.]
MRHNKKFNHLSRTSAHRKAMLSNMASSLIESKRISTTLAKAKALRSYVEPLITKAKNDTTHSRRVVFTHLQNKEAVSELFREVAAKVADRPGGYTRILRTGNRLGDNAEMCIIELVDYNEAMLEAKEEAKKPKRRRSRRGSSGSGGVKSEAKPAAEKSTSTEEKSEPKDEVKVVEDVQPVEETEEKTESQEEPKAEASAEEKKAEEKAEDEDKKKEE